MLSEFHELHPLLQALARSIVTAGGVFAVVLTLERLVGADVSNYRTRNFATDVCYGLFYQGGFYNILIWAPLVALLQPYLVVFDLNLQASLPLPVAYATYWLGMDFLGYWIHRLQHHSPLLWQFHVIHHSQERMTFITTNRLHLFDILFANLAVLIPVAVLGVPVGVWMPFWFTQQFLEYVQHSALPWRYGILYRLIVSPAFHAIHHDRRADRHHKNFGKMLSVWDFAFGTGDAGARPAAFGVVGNQLPENPLLHFVEPFRRLAGGAPWSRRRA